MTNIIVKIQVISYISNNKQVNKEWKMTENKMYAIIWSTLFICLTAGVICCVALYNNHVEKMAELGYEDGVVQGVQGTVWLKVKD